MRPVAATSPAIVLITGASNGIGRSIAQRVCDEGGRVVNLDRAPPAASLPGEDYIEVELTDRVATAAALRRVVNRSAPVVRLVNCVGMVRPASLEETRIEDLEAVLSLTLRCALQCTQALVPVMKAHGGGRIVNISSRSANGKHLRTAYSAAKAGLHGMTRTWALELAPFGVTVNAVAPGPIGTELYQRANPDDSPLTQATVATIPMKRIGRPEDVAQAVAFFLDDRSGYVTGQVLFVCGGLSVGQVPV